MTNIGGSYLIVLTKKIVIRMFKTLFKIFFLHFFPMNEQFYFKELIINFMTIQKHLENHTGTASSTMTVSHIYV